MEATAYDQFRELEDSHWWFRGRRSVYLGLLEAHLGGEAVGRALDLGCGMGGFLPGLDKLSSRVFPADISTSGLVYCRERGYDGGAVVDGYALPYADASFDLVCLFDTIEHIEDDAAVMREVARILTPGGRVFVSVPAYQFLYSNNDRIVHHHRRYTRSMLNEVFGAADLEVMRNTHTNVLLFPLILPVVLAIKCLERFDPRRKDPQHTNLSWPIPRFVHNLLHGVFAAELAVSKRSDIPVGHSIAAIARRK
ncbi:MAG: SAM-dependent methyltransferase [Planctomycetota bacterium]|jgi:SAM-dependent methyltransferase